VVAAKDHGNAKFIDNGIVFLRLRPSVKIRAIKAATHIAPAATQNKYLPKELPQAIFGFSQRKKPPLMPPWSTLLEFKNNVSPFSLRLKVKNPLYGFCIIKQEAQLLL